MSARSLPTPRTVITSLLNSLSEQSITTPSQTSSNALKDAPPGVKPLLLTLHVLFPNEFLPALDVLDRKLVTRFRVKHDAQVMDDEDDANDTGVYFVRSAQQHSSHSRFTNPVATVHEVRPLAWNCSCPAFAFSAFPAPPEEPITSLLAISPISKSADQGNQNTFGGLCLAEEGVPVCKHLLACVLVERCPSLFGCDIEAKDVTKEELAGWCAGWGG